MVWVDISDAKVWFWTAAKNQNGWTEPKVHSVQSSSGSGNFSTCLVLSLEGCQIFKSWVQTGSNQTFCSHFLLIFSCRIDWDIANLLVFSIFLVRVPKLLNNSCYGHSYVTYVTHCTHCDTAISVTCTLLLHEFLMDFPHLFQRIYVLCIYFIMTYVMDVEYRNHHLYKYQYLILL